MLIPSVNTLSALRYGNRESSPISFSDAKAIHTLLASCKSWYEALGVVNELLQGFGVEGWYKGDGNPCSCTYVNFGDSYAVTLCFVEEHPSWADGWKIMSWGGVAESC